MAVRGGYCRYYQTALITLIGGHWPSQSQCTSSCCNSIIQARCCVINGCFQLALWKSKWVELGTIWSRGLLGAHCPLITTTLLWISYRVQHTVVPWRTSRSTVKKKSKVLESDCNCDCNCVIWYIEYIYIYIYIYTTICTIYNLQGSWLSASTRVISGSLSFYCAY